jgi:peptidoglycan/LPS O-acetylase OafA/YrhL
MTLRHLPHPADRLAFLDLLRGIAALAVFFSHALVIVVPALGFAQYAYFDLGHFGVMLFFLCSGFIIPVSVERQGSLRAFWIRRFFRLYPLYWAALAVSLAFGYATGWHGYPEDFLRTPVACTAANMTMLQVFFGCSHLMGPAWTLMFELLFYLLVSLQFRLGFFHHAAAFAAGMLALAIAVEGVLPAFGIITANGILSFFGTMFTGAAIYRWHAGELRGRTAAALVALALLMEVATLAGDALAGLPVWRHWLTARLAAYVVFGAALAARRWPIPPALCWAGTISYSIYLIHPFVMNYVPLLPSPAPTFALWLAALLALSAASYRWIERPAIALGRRLTPGKGPRHASPDRRLRPIALCSRYTYLREHDRHDDRPGPG